MVLEKTLENPLDCKEIQPVHPKGNQSWIFIGRTDGEAETPILWPPEVKNWLIGKDPDAGKDWRQEEKGTIEDEMVGWHYWLNGHEFEQALGVGDGQGSLACFRLQGRKESDSTEQLNWTETAQPWSGGLEEQQQQQNPPLPLQYQSHLSPQNCSADHSQPLWPVSRALPSQWRGRLCKNLLPVKWKYRSESNKQNLCSHGA